MNARLICLFTMGLLLGDGLCWGQDWTRFRGPNGQGIATDVNLPIAFDEANIRWRTPLPAEGHSSPVLWGDKLFITCGTKSPATGIVVCLDCQSGKILWQKTYALAKFPMNALNHYAASTAAVDAEGVYVLWPTAEQFTLVALDHAGQERWQRDFGPMASKHGPCVSPALYRDMIVFTHEHESSSNNKGLGSRWLAVDKRNGDIRWELARKTERNSYMTPCVYTTSTGQDQLIFTSLAHGVSAVDPLTGTVLWEVPNVFDGRTIGSPVLMGDKIVATSGAGSSGKVLVVVQAPQTDQPARVLHRIETDLAPFVPTNLALGNRLYTFHDQGTIGCWDIDKGQPVWTEKTPYKFYGSPIALGQHIYCITTKGEVLVLQAGDTYQALAITPLDEKSQATPAVSDGRLYLRTLTQIVCVGT